MSIVGKALERNRERQTRGMAGTVASVEMLESRTLLSGMQIVSDVQPKGFVKIDHTVALNGKEYFTEWFSSQLWASGGTADTTVPLLNTNGTPDQLVANSQVFFFRQNGTVFNTSDLWISDGTTAGTAHVTAPGLVSDDGVHTLLGEKLFFAGRTEADSASPWISDGTSAGTFQLADATVDTGIQPVVSGDNVFFVGNNTSGLYLYKTNGTVAGTAAIWKIPTIFAEELEGYKGNVMVELPAEEWLCTPDGVATNFSNVFEFSEMTTWNGVVYFRSFGGDDAGEELWRSDGTAKGTYRLKDINPTGWSSPFRFTPLGSKLLFLANDGGSDPEWWVTDGTEQGTQPLLPDGGPAVSSLIGSDQTAVVGDYLFFTATTADSGSELWMTDGTAEGTRMVQDLFPGTSGSSPQAMQPVGDTLYLKATDSSFGTRLYKYTPEPKHDSTLALTASDDAPVYGEAVTYAAVVRPVPGIAPTGKVQFRVDGVNYGSLVPVVDEMATLEISGLTAGSHTITAVYDHDPLYRESTAAVSVNVAKAVLTVTADPQTKAYGQVNPTFTGAVSGLVNGDMIGASFASTASRFSAVGTYPITSVLNDPAGLAANYAVVSNPGVLTIEKADQNITWNTPAAITHGMALTTMQLSARALGLTGGTASGAVSYSPALGTILDAGVQTLTVTAAATANYNATTATVSLTVLKAKLTATAANRQGTYGQAVPALGGIVTGLVVSDGITVSYATDATQWSDTGTYVISAVFNDPAGKLANYDVVSNPGTLTIGRAAQVISWSKPADITYGTALSGTQLNATASGALDYSPTIGTILDAGIHTLTVTAAATRNYEAANTTVALTVSKATQTITWHAPANIVYGTPLGSEQLNAEVSGVAGGTLPGTLSYGVAPGTILSAGVQRLTVTAAATPNYSETIATVSLAVDKRVLTVTPDSKTKIYGQPTPALTGSMAGLLEGDDVIASFSVDAIFLAQGATQYLGVGTYRILAGLSNPETVANYAVVTEPATLTVEKADQVITWNRPAAITYGTALGTTQLNATAIGVAAGSAAGALTYGIPAGTVLAAGNDQVLSVTAAETANYNAATGQVTISVSRSRSVTTVVSARNPGIAKQSVTFTATVSPGVGIGPGGTVQFQIDGRNVGSPVALSGRKATYTAASLALGTHKIKAVYSGDANFAGSSSVTLSQTMAANKAPTSVSLNPAKVAENKPTGTAIGKLTAIDPNPGDTFTYSLVGGSAVPDNARFVIDGATLKTKASLNFEAKQLYSIRVRATDRGGLSFTRNMTVSVTNVNEAPRSLAVSNLAVAERKPAGTAVGMLSATDPDAGATFTYSLTNSRGQVLAADNAAFKIVRTAAGMQLQTRVVLDYETKPTYSLRIRVTDQGGLSYEKSIIVSVRNVAE